MIRVLPAAVFSGVAIGAAVVAWSSIMPVVLLGLIGLAAILVVRRFLPLSPLSPVWVASGSYVVIALFGLIYYPLANPVFGGGIPSLSSDLVDRSAVLFLTSAVFLLSGAACYLALVGVRRRDPVTAPSFASSATINWLLVLAAIVPTLLLIVGNANGIHTFLHRPTYIEGRVGNSQAAALGQVLAIAAITLSGYCWSIARSNIVRALSLGVTFLYMVIFFSLASRFLSLAPIAFALGLYAANPASRGAKVTMALAVVLSLMLLALPLQLRSSSDHGFFPYLRTLEGHDPNVAAVQWEALPLNILSTFGVSGNVAFGEPSIPLRDLWTSVSPLPGTAASWYQIEPSHRLSIYVPYSTIGELGNYGLPILAAYFFFAGVVLAFLESRAAEFMSRGQHIFGLPLVGAGLLFTLLSLQYQLRSVTRILYFGLLVVAAGVFLQAVGGWNAKRSRPAPAVISSSVGGARGRIGRGRV